MRITDCLGTPAATTQNVWPALYDVIGGAANDTLNQRENPDAVSSVFRTLAPDGSNIDPYGC